jgi:phosphoribosylanthranilate isomerase
MPISLIQFHGEEAAEFCQQFHRPWIKALRMSVGIDLPARCAAYGEASGILLDSWQEGVPGGTGMPFDWELARRSLPLPLVLAGGLDEHNVGQALALLQPSAVDVSGGVEQAPGRKDAGKIERFIAAVRAADALLDGIADDD